MSNAVGFRMIGPHHNKHHMSMRGHSLPEHLLTRCGYDPARYRLCRRVYGEPSRVSIDGRVIEWSHTDEPIPDGSFVVLEPGAEFVACPR